MERCEAAINFIAFAEFYKDWKANAEEGNREFNYGGVPTALNLIPFRLGQLIGRKSDFMDDLDFETSDGLHTDEQLFRNALFNLEIEARPNVVAALQEHYGGISGFFVELWNSDKQPQPADYADNRQEYEYARDFAVGQLHIWEPPYQETDDDILNDVTDEKMYLWTWLDQGAEPLGRY